MSTSYTNDPYLHLAAAGQRPNPQNYGPWYDDFGPIRPGDANLASHVSASLGKRTLMTAAVAAVGAGAIVGLFAFSFDRAEPGPADTTVMVPGYSYPQTSQLPAGQGSAPNAAVPPSGSSRGVVVNVPPAVRSGGPANGPVQGGDPNTDPKKGDDTNKGGDPNTDPKKDDDTNKGGDPNTDPKKGDDTNKGGDGKKDTDPKKDEDPKNEGPFVPPPDVVTGPKQPGDIIKSGPDLEPAPKFPGDVYTKPAESPSPGPINLPDQPVGCLPFMAC
jgi:hypothetical protein